MVGEPKGTNNKVGKLCRLAEEARYPLLIITDSDVRVAPNYLRKVAAQFEDPKVGAVTALYRAIEAPSFGAIMDTMDRFPSRARLWRQARSKG